LIETTFTHASFIDKFASYEGLEYIGDSEMNLLFHKKAILYLPGFFFYNFNMTQGNQYWYKKAYTNGN
jgi:hypothetical protein